MLQSEEENTPSEALANETSNTVEDSFPSTLERDTIDHQKTTKHGNGQRKLSASPYAWPHDGSFSRETTALVMVDMQRDCKAFFLFHAWGYLVRDKRGTTQPPPLGDGVNSFNERGAKILVCSHGGYFEQQGYDIAPVRALIPTLQRLLHAFRTHRFTIYHTREGHRPDLSTLSSRERFRSKNNLSGLGIGSYGPLGRLLVRGEPGHDTIPELYPLADEPVLDKPGRGLFAYTEFELMLRVRGIRNLIVAGVTTDACVGSIIREASDRGFDCLLLEDGTQAAEKDLHRMTCESMKQEGGLFGTVGRVEDVSKMLESFERTEN